MTDQQNQLEQSYNYCRRIARERARNFYYSFMVLPREKSSAMCAVYAFMRYCDDIADDPDLRGDRELMLAKWGESLEKAAKGNYLDSRILPAFHHTIMQYNIPLKYFHELIDGASMDLRGVKYKTFDDLYDYCYKVASVVGLVCIHIFGFDSPSAGKYAEYCGIAFQLTNVLRDVREDAAGGRVYIPEEDLWAFGYSAEDLARGVADDRFLRLMKFEISRAQDYYNAARPLVPLVHKSGRAGLCAMIEIYSSILSEIARRPQDVMNGAVSISKAKKLSIAARSLVSPKLNGGRKFLQQLQS